MNIFISWQLGGEQMFKVLFSRGFPSLSLVFPISVISWIRSASFSEYRGDGGSHLNGIVLTSRPPPSTASKLTLPS